MPSDVAREQFHDDFVAFSDRTYLPKRVRSVHLIYGLLTVSYLLIVVLFITSLTRVPKVAEPVKSNDTAVALASIKSNVQAVSKKTEAIKSEYKADLTKLKAGVESGVDGQRILRSEITALQDTVGNLVSKITDLENSMKKEPPANACGSGPEAWEYFGGSCYLFVNSKSNWMAAKHMCISKGATLAIITSEGEQNFIKGKSKGQLYWIGLTDMNEESQWEWIDGTDYKTSVKFWKPDEPNDSNKNEDCAHVWKEGQWNDVHCTNQLLSICEKKAATQ